MNLTLRMHSAGRPQRAAAAWFLPGTPADWLDELVRWELPLLDVRLYPLSGGALAVPPPGLSPAAPGRGLPYGLAGARLYVPVDAVFSPEVRPAELDALIPESAVFIWQPAEGVTEFERDEALGPCDLLRALPAAAADWGRAQPGEAISSRLLSIEPDQPLDPRFALEEGRGDIGRDAAVLDQLPPHPREPAPGAISAAGRALQAGIARGILGLTNLIPGGARDPTWVNRVQDWAARQLGGLADGILAQRHRELMRLLHQLQTDPDRGLRHALPLAGAAHRGLAPPGGRLGERNIDFNLGRLGGGRPADQWDVPGELRLQLLARYRELANREIGLGRHRRAAYILAELLGDLNSAAATLADGRHWREAAALYEHRLSRPAEAARCLERGGLWAEAIALYEKLADHERAGDLHRQLEHADEAERAFRLATEKQRSAGDYLAAARILEQKLSVPEEARVCLLEGWRASQQRAKCLEELFQLHTRRADHGGAAELIEALRRAADRMQTAATATATLATVAARYPDARVRLAAADATRLLAAERLPAADPSEVDALTQAVSRLAPEDRLLGRDCQRYAQGRRAARPLPAPRPPAGPWRLLREFSLPAGVWMSAIGQGKVFFAAGYRGSELSVACGLWDGSKIIRPETPWKPRNAHQRSSILLSADLSGVKNHLLVHPLGKPLEHSLRFLEMDGFPPTTVGSHRGIEISTIAAQFGAEHRLYQLSATDSDAVELTVFAADGALLATYAVPPTEHDLDGRDLFLRGVPFVTRGRDCYFALGKSLYVAREGKPVDVRSMDAAIRSLAVSPPHSRTRIVVGLENGGVVFWTEDLSEPPEWFDRDLPAPRVGLNWNGQLIAAADDRVEVYDTRNRRLSLRATIPLPQGDPPVAVLAPLNPDEFAVLTQSGRMKVYELSRKPQSR